jgi:hypothetical protein
VEHHGHNDDIYLDLGFFIFQKLPPAHHSGALEICVIVTAGGPAWCAGGSVTTSVLPLDGASAPAVEFFWCAHDRLFPNSDYMNWQ